MMLSAIGRDTQASNVDSIALGRNTSTLADGAVALGAGVQATRANTVSVNELEVKIKQRWSCIILTKRNWI